MPRRKRSPHDYDQATDTTPSPAAFKKACEDRNPMWVYSSGTSVCGACFRRQEEHP